MPVYPYASAGRGMSDQGKYQPYLSALIEKLRNNEQLIVRPDVLAAFERVPRHLFLHDMPYEQVYQDTALPLKRDASGQVISSSSQPTMMAIMLDQLNLRPGDNVLEIGAASGYNAAIMGRVVGSRGHVTTIELDYDLAQLATDNLNALGVDNVVVVQADGAIGYAPRAQYDRIIATVGVWDIPQAWLNQLKPDGVIVVPLWLDGVQVSLALRRQADGTFTSADNRPCAFVYLRGEQAGPDMRRRVGSSSLVLMADQINQLDTAALAQLLSEVPDEYNIEAHLTTFDYWHGFQMYLMLNEPPEMVFAVYAVIEGQKAFGLEGNGIALFGPASASFAPYQGRGRTYCFGGSESFLRLHEIFDQWAASGYPRVDRLRVRVVPHGVNHSAPAGSKVYRRTHNDIHVWFDLEPRQV